RRAGLRAAQETEIPGDVVCGDLDDPAEFRTAVVRPLRLDGVVKPGDCLADQFVQPLDDGMQIRHHAPEPILDVRVIIRWHRRLSGRVWLACFRHRTSVPDEKPPSEGWDDSTAARPTDGKVTATPVPHGAGRCT